VAFRFSHGGGLGMFWWHTLGQCFPTGVSYLTSSPLNRGRLSFRDTRMRFFNARRKAKGKGYVNENDADWGETSDTYVEHSGIRYDYESNALFELPMPMLRISRVESLEKRISKSVNDPA